MPMWPNYASRCPVFLLERQEGSPPCMQRTTICWGLVNREGWPIGESLVLDMFDGRSASGAGTNQPILAMIIGTAIFRGLLAQVVPSH